MQARDERIVGSDCLIQLAKTAAGERECGRQVERADHRGSACGAQDWLSDRIADQPCTNNRGKDGDQSSQARAQAGGLRFRVPQAANSGRSARADRCTHNFAIDEGIGITVDIDDIALRRTCKRLHAGFPIRIPD